MRLPVTVAGKSAALWSRLVCTVALLGTIAVLAAAPAVADAITGNVTTSSGVPAEGVYFGTRLDPKILYKGPKSAADGGFSLEIASPEQRHWLAISPQLDRMAVFAIPEALSGPISVSLDFAAGEVYGRVVDAAGQPMPRGKVVLRVTGPGGDEFISNPLSTDAQGYYQTEYYIPLGDGIRIEAGLAGSPEQWGPAVAAGPYTLPLEMPDLTASGAAPAGTREDTAEDSPRRLVRYAGTVRDTGGAPVAGARLRFLYDHEGAGMNVKWAVSNAEGRWARLLPAQMTGFQMNVEHPEYMGNRQDRSILMPSMDDMRAGTGVITLARGRVLEGRVVAPDGAPVPHALVSAEVTMEEGPACVASGPDGAYRLACLARGFVEVVAMAPGYAATPIQADLREAVTTRDIVLDAGGTIRGRIRNDQGEPVAGAKVELHEWLLNRQHWLRTEVQSDGDGAFAFEHVPLQGSLRFYIGAGPYQGVSTEALYCREEPYEIVLHKPATVEGRVTDAETGQPVHYFKMRQGFLQSDGTVSWNECAGDKHVPSLTGAFQWEAKNVILSWPDESAIVFGIFARGYVPAVTPKVSYGNDAGPVQIALVRGKRLAGTVADSTDAPVKGADVIWVGEKTRVWIQDGLLQPNSATVEGIRDKTNTRGLFELLPCNTPGTLLVLHETGWAQVPVDAFEPDSTITLRPWACVQGDCYASGKPTPGVTVRMEPLREDPDRAQPIVWNLHTTSSETGHYVFNKVPDLPLVLGYSGPDFEVSHTQRVAPEPGETVTADVGHAPGRVEGQAVWDAALLEGLPPSSEPVLLMAVLDGKAEEGGYTPHYCVSADLTGAFSIENVSPAPYDLTVELHAPRPPMACGNGMLLAQATAQVTVLDGTLTLPPLRLDRPDAPLPGAAAPPLEAKTLVGDAFSLAAVRGKWVVLDFWASWCVPCREESRKLKGLWQQYAGDARVAFVGVAFDYDAGRAASSVKAGGYGWTQVCGEGWGEDNPVITAFRIAAIPSIWVIDPQGTVLARDVRAERAEEILREALAAP